MLKGLKENFNSLILIIDIETAANSANFHTRYSVCSDDSPGPIIIVSRDWRHGCTADDEISAHGHCVGRGWEGLPGVFSPLNDIE